MGDDVIKDYFIYGSEKNIIIIELLNRKAPVSMILEYVKHGLNVRFDGFINSEDA